MGIYEGNQANAADKFGLFNKSYAQGYKRFARLYRNGIDDHLNKKTGIKILGPDGIDKTIYITKRDVKPNQEYDIMVESTNAELNADMIDKRNKLTFLSPYSSAIDPTIRAMVNQKKAFEMEATIAGFKQDEIRELLDTSEYGEAQILSEAERDMEDILAGKQIQPNLIANTAYAKRILDYMIDHKEDMDDATFQRFSDYMNAIEPIVMKNMANQLQNTLAKEGLRAGVGGAPGPGEPTLDQGIPPEGIGSGGGLPNEATAPVALPNNVPGGTQL